MPLEQVAANAINFQDPRHLSVVIDAKRLGVPDEETETYYVWEAASNYSCVPPPHVSEV